MAVRSRHPFHLVDNSPWPIFRSLFALGLTVGRIKIFYFGSPRVLGVAGAGLVIVSAQ